MRYTQNKTVYESTTQDATDWASINWYKVDGYVDKLQKRIYHAESIGDSRKKVNLSISNVDKILMNYGSDKILLEPDVWITDMSGSYEGADERLSNPIRPSPKTSTT